METRTCFAALLLAALAVPAHGQNFIDVLPGGHATSILGVSYEIDGVHVDQTTEATGVQVRRDAPVYLKSVTIQDGAAARTLDTFNSLGAAVTNVGFSALTGGVGVFDNGIKTHTQDPAAFASALAATTQDTDLMNYNFYDGVSHMPAAGVADYDLLFQHGFESSDFILVSERWGNTFFTLTPLDASGNAIAGANLLRFGYPTGSAYTKYDWNSGYAASSYQSEQAMAFSVVAVSKFFESASAASQPVYGFRIDNDGEADVKFFGLSDRSFADNPLNTHAASPEPSALLLTVAGLLPLVLRRRRP